MKRKGNGGFWQVVVMGDIVESEKFPSKRMLHDVFNAAVNDINVRHEPEVTSPLTITLGDEFQGLTNTFSAGFSVAHDLRLYLLKKQVRCRFVVGIVEIETPLNRERAWNMMGAGLAEARDKLNQKNDPNAYRFSLYNDPELTGLLDAVGLSLTFIEDEWSEVQLGYVTATHETGGDTGAIAAERGVSIRSVYKGLKAANFDFYERQTKALLNYLSSYDRHLGLGASRS